MAMGEAFAGNGKVGQLFVFNRAGPRALDECSRTVNVSLRTAP